MSTMMSSYSGVGVESQENSTRNSVLMPVNQFDASQKGIDLPTEPIRWKPSSSSNSHSDTDYDMSDDTEGSPEPQSSLGLYVIGDQIQDLLNHGYEYITPEEDRAKDQEALASAFKTLDSAMPVFTEPTSFVSQSTTASPPLYSDFNGPFTPTEPYFSKFVSSPRYVVNRLPLGSTNVARYTTINPSVLIGIPPDPSNFLVDIVMAARHKAMGRDVKGVTFLLPDPSPSCDAQENGAHRSQYAELAFSGAHPIVQPPQNRPSGTDEATSGPVSLSDDDMDMNMNMDLDGDKEDDFEDYQPTKRNNLPAKTGSSRIGKRKVRGVHGTITWKSKTPKELSDFCKESFRDRRYYCRGFDGSCEDKSYGSDNVFKRHLLEKHSDTVFRCDISGCSYSCSRADLIKRHMGSIHRSI